ncbi:MAG: AzlC family ABC transporter permease [Pseudomonadota bacterium]|nr:AzlC family ABC transporter permease [Pseudomonadota bacterium]
MAFPTDMTGTPPGCSGASFLAGIRDASGMFFGALLFGILFGSAASVAGLDMGQTVAMSAFIFAGTAQFATLALWSDQMPYFAILISAAMVTSRLTLMGLSLGPTIRGLSGPLRLPAIFVINDAAWALTLQAKSIPNKSAYYLGVSAPMYVIWVAATAVGVFSAGLFDPVTAKSLAFAGIVFLSILVGVVVRGVDAPRAPLAVSAGVGIALDGVIEPGAAVLVAVAAGAVTALASEVMRDAR